MSGLLKRCHCPSDWAIYS